MEALFLERICISMNFIANKIIENIVTLEPEKALYFDYKALIIKFAVNEIYNNLPYRKELRI